MRKRLPLSGSNELKISRLLMKMAAYFSQEAKASTVSDQPTKISVKRKQPWILKSRNSKRAEEEGAEKTEIGEDVKV